MTVKTPIAMICAFCFLASCKKNGGTNANGNPN